MSQTLALGNVCVLPIGQGQGWQGLLLWSCGARGEVDQEAWLQGTLRSSSRPPHPGGPRPSLHGSSTLLCVRPTP